MSDDDPSLHVLTAQSDAAKRGALAIWTVYDRPEDYPSGDLARIPPPRRANRY
jgi:hypothetical protein